VTDKPALTANEMFRDALMRRQVWVMRYAKTLSRKIIAMIDSTEADLQDHIEGQAGKLVGGSSFDKDATERLNTLASKVSKVRGGAFDKVRALMDFELTALAISEVDYVDNALHHACPVKIKTVIPTDKKLTALVSMHPIQGHPLDKHHDNLKFTDTDRIMAAVRTGLAQGSDIDAIIQAVRGASELAGSNGVLEATRRAIVTVVHTAVTTIVNEVRQAYFRAN
jgi:hypothetical protein